MAGQVIGVGWDSRQEEVGSVHSFKKLSLKRFPKVDARESSELRFWGKFKVWNGELNMFFK